MAVSVVPMLEMEVTPNQVLALLASHAGLPATGIQILLPTPVLLLSPFHCLRCLFSRALRWKLGDWNSSFTAATYWVI